MRIKMENGGENSHDGHMEPSIDSPGNETFYPEGGFLRRKPRPTPGDLRLLEYIGWGIIFVLLLTPLFKAGVLRWTALIMEIAVLSMTAAWILIKRKPAMDPLLRMALKWPARLLVALFGVILLQVLPLPVFLLRLISPESVRFRMEFTPGFDGTGFATISLMPGRTLLAGLELLVYVLLAFLVFQTVQRREQVRRLLYVVVGMGIFQAFYGFFELYNPNPRLLFFKKIHYLGDVTGTFVNRNHLSGYLEMVIPLALALLLARSAAFALKGRTWKEKLLRAVESGRYPALLLGLAVALMGAAVFASHSRSGAALLFLTFLLFLELTVLASEGLGKLKGWMKRALAAAGAGLTFLALVVGIDATVQRFAMDNILSEQRPVFWAQTIDIFQDYPLLGSGLGTYEGLYAAYDQSGFGNHPIHAHNDWLEFLAELGVVGMALLAGAVIWILVVIFRMWRQRRDPEIKALGMGGLVAVAVILLHGVTDFNLHVPANAALFAVVLALSGAGVYLGAGRRVEKALAMKEAEGLQQALDFGPRGQGRLKQTAHRIRRIFRRKPRTRRGPGFFSRPAGKTAAVLGLVMLAAGAGLAYWNHHLLMEGSRREDPRERGAVLERATGFYPLDDEAPRLLGRARYETALAELSDNAARDRALAGAQAALERSLRLNPAEVRTQFLYARILQMRDLLEGEDLNPALARLRRVVRLAGPNSRLRFETAKLLLENWDELSERGKAVTLKMLRLGLIGSTERFRELLPWWEMNCGDMAVIDAVIPDNTEAYRLYARYLGERGLAPEWRKSYLAAAEMLDLDVIRERFRRAESAFRYNRWEEAEKLYRDCVERIGRIRFYQDLTGKPRFDESEVVDIRREALGRRLRCRMAETQDPGEIRADFDAYLEAEDRRDRLEELEQELVERGFLENAREIRVDDLDRLVLRLTLWRRHNRFAEILAVADRLRGGFVDVPVPEREDYARVMRTIGDAARLSDYILRAEESYKQSLEAKPGDLDALLGLRLTYERINETGNVRDLDRRISELTSPNEMVWGEGGRREEFRDSGREAGGASAARRAGERIRALTARAASARRGEGNEHGLDYGYPIEKGRALGLDLVLQAGEAEIELEFARERSGLQPLVTVLFNGRAVWEGIPGEAEAASTPDSDPPAAVARFRATCRSGSNRIEVLAVSRAARLLRIGRKPVEEEAPGGF